MAASDCLLTASGTVTLEAALIKRPMVICYKFSAVTYLLARFLVKLKWFSLPNLLANKSLVPELLQKEVCAEKIVPLVRERLYQDQSQLDESYRQIHQQIKCDASKQAAKAVIDVLADKA
jgi:lipid-A-disaccharide synthase